MAKLRLTIDFTRDTATIEVEAGTVKASSVQTTIPTTTTEEKEYTRDGHLLATPKQKYRLEQIGQWREGMLSKEAWYLINEHEKKQHATPPYMNGKGEYLPFDEPKKRGRGRPKKMGL